MPHQKMKLHGNWFPATVTNNNHPTKDGKIKTRIPGVDDGIDDGQLPWALSMSGFGGGAHSGIIIPPVGSSVFVFFPSEDTHFRYYLGCNTLGATKDLAALIEDYPNGYVTVDPMGVTTIANTAKLKYSIGFPDGSGFSWDNGDIVWKAAKSMIIEGGNSLTLHAGTTTVQGGTLSLNGSSTTVNGGGLTLNGGSISINGPVTQRGGGSPSMLSLNVGDIPNTKPKYAPAFTKRDSQQTITPDATLTDPKAEAGD